MVALTLITLGNVLTRYLSDQSFAWTEEISVFLIVVMTLAGAAGVARRDGHIRIEYFYEGGSSV
ncbi:MAG TPA: TRAP transporter small permease, partial [Caldimonas sp.]